MNCQLACVLLAFYLRSTRRCERLASQLSASAERTIDVANLERMFYVLAPSCLSV